MHRTLLMCGRGYHVGPFTTVIRKHPGGQMTKDGMICKACASPLDAAAMIKMYRMDVQIGEIFQGALAKAAKEKS